MRELKICPACNLQVITEKNRFVSHRYTCTNDVCSASNLSKSGYLRLYRTMRKIILRKLNKGGLRASIIHRI